jgi:CRISPR/Cas system-associated exonuclease Cas4 (RecB family)
MTLDDTFDMESKIEKEFLNRVRDWMESENAKRGKYFHVSSFVYQCARKVWYEQTIEKEAVPKIDEDGLIRTWIGTKLHETPITNYHEHPLIAQISESDFGGRLDEIYEIDGKKVLIDKKFVGYIPNTMNDHHYEQIMYYAALLRETEGIVVDAVGISYFKPSVSYRSEKRYKTYVRSVSEEDLDEYIKKIHDMVGEVEKHLADNTLPDKTVSWYCKYCFFKQSCDADSKEFVSKEVEDLR